VTHWGYQFLLTKSSATMCVWALKCRWILYLSLMKYKEISCRVLVPFRGGEMFDDNEEYWAETCFGNFMESVYIPNIKSFKWFWFTRYEYYLSKDTFIKKYVEKDKNFTRPSEDDPKETEYRCIYLRMEIKAADYNKIKSSIEEYAEERGYKAVRFESYNKTEDFGSDRFAPTLKNKNESFNKKLKKIRASDFTNFMYYTCRMLFWCLRKNEKGWYIPEKNLHPYNATTKSTLESFHHMFCNATNVPLVVFEKDGKVGTHIYPFEGCKKDDPNVNRIDIKF